MHVAVVGVAAVQKISVMASKGYNKEAPAHIRSVQKLMKRGAKSSTQMQERLAFRGESEALRKELKEAVVSDVVRMDVPRISDHRIHVLSYNLNCSISKFHGSSGPSQLKVMKDRKSNSQLTAQYYGFQS